MVSRPTRPALSDVRAVQQAVEVLCALLHLLQHQRQQVRQRLHRRSGHGDLQRALLAGEQHAAPHAAPHPGALAGEVEADVLQQREARDQQTLLRAAAGVVLRQLKQRGERRLDQLLADRGVLRVTRLLWRYANRAEDPRLDENQHRKAVRNVHVAAAARLHVCGG